MPGTCYHQFINCKQDVDSLLFKLAALSTSPQFIAPMDIAADPSSNIPKVIIYLISMFAPP